MAADSISGAASLRGGTLLLQDLQGAERLHAAKQIARDGPVAEIDERCGGVARLELQRLPLRFEGSPKVQ